MAESYYKIEQIQTLYTKNKLSRKRWINLGYASVAVITIGGGTILSVVTGMPLLSYTFAYVVSGAPLLWTTKNAQKNGAILSATDNQMVSGKTVTYAIDIKHIATKLDEALLKLSGLSNNLNPQIKK